MLIEWINDKTHLFLARHLNRDPNKPPGPWASLVHDYCELRDNITGKTPDLIAKGTCDYVPQRLPQKCVDEQTKILEDVTDTILLNEKQRKSCEEKVGSRIQGQYVEEGTDSFKGTNIVIKLYFCLLFFLPCFSLFCFNNRYHSTE